MILLYSASRSMHDQYLNFGKVTHYWHTKLYSNYFCGFVVTGDTTESFWAVNLVVFKKKKEIIGPYLSNLVH